MALAIEGWKQWLNMHTTSNRYSTATTKVKDICVDGATPTEIFDKSVFHKNIVSLTKAPLGGKIQTTFFHSTIGIPIIETDMQYVARMVMSTGSEMKVDPSSLFVKTGSKHQPTIIDMIKVTNITELNTLTIDQTKAKRRCHFYVLLTPALAEAIQSTNMKALSVFIKMVETIKAQTTPTTTGDQSTGKNTILTYTTAPYMIPFSTSSGLVINSQEK